MIHAVVFGVSFSALAFEVLLARIFSISQWNHLSFMVISIALFGFAASGSFLSLLDLTRWSRAAVDSQRKWAALLAVLCSASIISALLGLSRLPLDYFRLLLEPVQLVYLLAMYLLLILPFFFAGGVISIAYLLYPEKPGPVYFASMIGSALGAIAPAALLAGGSEIAAVGLVSLVPLLVLSGWVSTARTKKKPGKTRPGAAAARVLVWALVCAAGLWLLTPGAGNRFDIRSSEYKLLTQTLQFPATQVVESVSGIRGRMQRVQSPHLRFAPGLSLKYADAPPAAEAVFTDGDQPFFLYDLRSPQMVDFARFTLSFMGYNMVEAADTVLLISAGGGLAIPCALASGARAVRIVQQNPYLAERIRRHYGLEVVRESPRSFLAQTAERFDVIHIENWGPAMPGADALNQDHLLTVDSLLECLRRLTPGGVIVISRKLLLPPAGSLRLWATAHEALVRAGEPDPERCIAALRNWDTFTLAVSRRPIPDPQRLLEFAQRRNFDVVYLEGAGESTSNRFNVFDAPYHFREIRRMQSAFAEGRSEAFFGGYVLDVAPQRDLRPFPGRFLKWDRILDLYEVLGRRLHALFLAGEMIVSVVLIEALLVTGLLLLAPLAFIRRRTLAPCGSTFVFFLGIGAGFMFAELLLVHAGIFFLGDPVISLAVVVTCLLISSALGGIWTRQRGPVWVCRALAAAAASLVLAAGGLWFFARELLALPETWRYAALSIFIMIPGFFMGAPFPLGMRFLLQNAADRTFAWAVNGCFSVLASIAAAQIAISVGFAWIAAAAVACYAFALWGGRTGIFPTNQMQTGR
jgi:hypothetical protein